MNEVILQYKSRRNHALLIRRTSEKFVKKVFSEGACYQRELEIYQILSQSVLPVADLIDAGDNVIILSHLSGVTLLQVLEDQEKKMQIDFSIWDALTEWIIGFYQVTGYVLNDLNLCNFIYDEEARSVTGIDFEECTTGNPVCMAASLAAYIRLYKPENTAVKRQISNHILTAFASYLSCDFQVLYQLSKEKELFLLQRRKKRK